MFTKRIIPCLDVHGGRVVKGVNFVNLVDAGDPVAVAKAYDEAGADEIVFLDITASSDARETVIDMVREVAKNVFIPFTVGGGIRTVDDFKALLREGADKISIRLEPTLKNSTYGAPFDSEGIGLRRLNIIEKGIVKNMWGSNAKSQYINKPVNGTFSNFVVNSGTLTNEQLEDETYLEVIALSGFEIDELTGDFGSEIRLAYLHQKNKEVSIVTGGSISGNVYESLQTVKFNNVTKQNNNFIGPINVMLDNVNINGGE